MPITTIPLPYGLRDVKVTPFTTVANTTLGTGVDFPYARTLSFGDSEEFEELRGDDKVVATVGRGAAVEWSLEGGGFSFEAVKILFGGTIVETGTTPAMVKKMSKKPTDVRSYVQLEGQSISDSGGDFHCKLFRARATGNLEGEMGDGQFWLTGASGVALPSLVVADVDKLYEFTQNETAAANV